MPRLPQRLKGFNYRTPYFYMVTIHARPGLPEAFSAIDSQGCVMNPLTRVFMHAIRGFHMAYPEIDPVTCFTIMPDHLHLLIHLREGMGRHSLIEVVETLKETLAQVYFKTSGIPLPPAPMGLENFLSLKSRVFVDGFHDYIVKRPGQLKRFTRYIRTNPQRSWLRGQAREKGWFNRVRLVEFAGRRWYAYGNVALLDLPEIVPLKGHRATRPNTPEWNELVAQAGRLGAGCAGVSTFMSAHEKACGRAIGLAGGNWIILSPEGFPPQGDGRGYLSSAGEPTRWHPGERREKWCAKGRMLFLSLWEGGVRRLDNTELWRRCHEMGEVVGAGLRAD